MTAIVKLETKNFDPAPINPCWISTLYVKNFRNHAVLSIDVPSAVPVILTGANGVGKTSLLEAISLLGPGRGLRQAPPQKIVYEKAEEPFWGVSAKITRAHGIEEKISVLCKVDKKTETKVKINNRASSSLALANRLSLFWLTPAMARFYSEGSQRSHRRKFMDRMVMGVEPAHAKNLADFERLKKQRQIVLDGNKGASWLDVLEVQMAECALEIARARKDIIVALNEQMANLKPDNFPTARLSILGDFEEQCLGEENIEDKTKAYQAHLTANRSRDRVATRTHLGPHQTDFALFNETQNQTAQQCSTGEVKALLLGLVLAAASLAQTIKSIKPIILLDEVAAHLDEGRRYALFNKIGSLEAQMWLTGTEPKTFAPLKMDAHFFDIQASKAHPS